LKRVDSVWVGTVDRQLAPEVREARGVTNRVLRNPRNQKLMLTVVAAASMFLMAGVFNNERTMHPHFSASYLSGAANLSLADTSFRVDPMQIGEFVRADPAQQGGLSFANSEDSVLYPHNPVGYAHFVRLSTTVFPFLGDIHAVELLQIALHVLTTLMVVSWLPRASHRVGFLVLYGLNPVVLHFVTFPFYYCLQALPAILVIRYLVGAGPLGRWFTVAAAASYMVFLTRPSVALLVAAYFSIALLHERRPELLRAALVVAALHLFLYHPTSKDPYFTMYVGLGAYPNSYGIELADQSAYDLYEQRLGEVLVLDLEGIFLPETQSSELREIVREEYLSIATDAPTVVARNAVTNTLQGFSIGYVNGASRFVNYAISLTGLAFLALLMRTRQWLLICLIVASLVTVTAYFPPIPAYMFATYPLLVHGALQIVEHFGTYGRSRHGGGGSSVATSVELSPDDG